MSDMQSPVLVPTEVSTVDFYGDPIVVAVIDAAGQTELFVPLRPLCQYLGLAWSGQFERTQRDPVLAEVLQIVRIGDDTRPGGRQDMVTIPLEYLPGWLFGISVSRVHPRLHESLYRYRKECFRVLASQFPQSLFRSLFAADELAPATGIPGVIYVAYGDGYYKIGTSRNVAKRIQSFNSSLPFKVTLVHTIDADDASTLERHLHRFYRAAGKHINGEWFRLDDADVAALKAIRAPMSSVHYAGVIAQLRAASPAKEIVYEQ